MSSEQDQAKVIAARVARRLAERVAEDDAARGESLNRNELLKQAASDEVATLRQSLREVQERLTQIEARLTREERDALPKTNDMRGGGAGRLSSDAATHVPLLSGIYVPATATNEHPSTERFGVNEATAIAELVDFFENEKTCSMEPGNKPCDHCAMCSSRGF